MLKRFLKNQRGLTLVELLAVIVILGIIAAIAVPNIGGLINKTKQDAVEADAVQVLNAAKLYMTTNSVKVKNNGDSYVISRGQTTATITSDDGELDEYLDNVPDTYSVTVTKTNGKFVFSEIFVRKGSNQKYFATESAVIDGDDTTPTKTYK